MGRKVTNIGNKEDVIINRVDYTSFQVLEPAIEGNLVLIPNAKSCTTNLLESKEY